MASQLVDSKPQMSTSWWCWKVTQGDKVKASSSGKHECLHTIKYQYISEMLRYFKWKLWLSGDTRGIFKLSFFSSSATIIKILHDWYESIKNGGFFFYCETCEEAFWSMLPYCNGSFSAACSHPMKRLISKHKRLWVHKRGQWVGRQGHSNSVTPHHITFSCIWRF